MSALVKAVQIEGQQAGQPATASGSQEPAPSSAPAPQFVTRDDVQAILEEQRRQEQAARDKAIASVQKQFDAKLKQLEAVGVQLTDAQKQALQQATASEVLQAPQTPEPSQPMAGQPAAAEPGNGQETSWLDKWAETMDAKAGTTLSTDDVEAGQVDSSDPAAFMETYQKALQAKVERLARDKNPAARMPTIGGGNTPGNPIANITDPTELLIRGFAKKKG